MLGIDKKVKKRQNIQNIKEGMQETVCILSFLRVEIQIYVEKIV